jgi:GNAT superfamily N-acetyltransferase
MPSSLSTATLRTVERLWEERMHAPKGTLGSSGVSIVEWPGFTAAVILDIGGTLIVAGPAEAIALLRHLSPQRLVDADVAASALLSLRPRLIGKALLGYADESTFTPAPSAHKVRQADLSAAEQVLSHCDADDGDESGLSEMNAWFVAEEDGVPVAAAGYEGWPGSVAHCGVAVGARHRGRGLGQSVASAAVGHALAGHAVAQWRSRDTNATSTRLGERLGFMQLGSQTAFDLHT